MILNFFIYQHEIIPMPFSKLFESISNLLFQIFRVDLRSFAKFNSFVQIYIHYLEDKMMKFIFVPHIDEVPQWKQCYYDVKTLNHLIQIIQQSSDFLKVIREQFIKAKNQKKSLLKIEHISRCEFQLRDLMRECNQKFYQYSLNEIETIFVFVQMKTFELKQKVQRLRTYSMLIQRSNNDLLGLLQNVYIQVYYLKRMVTYNKAQKIHTIKSYQANIYQYEAFYDGQIITRRMDRIYQYVKKLSEQIQTLYMLKNMKPQSKAMKQLLFYGDTSGQQNLGETYSLGFSMGVLLILFGIVIFLKMHFNITLQSNKTYLADFPVWRGASYLVIYQWIIGVVLLVLQKSQVNYKLILQLQQEFFPKSRSIFVGAQISTIIFLVFFGVYLLTLGEHIQHDFKYLGQIVWVFILGYLFIPIPFANNGGKFYFMKLIFFVIISPLTRCNIIIIWLSEQMVSFSQPVTDLAYTICKVQHYHSKCTQVTKINMIVLVIFFSYRVIQNIRMIYQAGWKIVPPFYGLFRASFTIVTIVVSYNYKINPTDNNLIGWVITAFITTCTATFVDVKADWGFLNQSLLRKNLFFSDFRCVYYIIFILNIFLRCVWVLNISPNIVNSLHILPHYFIMIVAYLELFRRGLWNILRLQFQHTSNCQKFKATVDDSAIQARVKEKYLLKGGSLQTLNREQYRQIRQKAQFQLVVQSLQNRQDFKETIGRFIIKKQQTLAKLEKQLITYGIRKK